MNQLDSELWDAIHKKDLKSAQNLLDQGADIENKDVKGRTILRCYATDSSYQKANEWLISKGADLNSQDNYGDTALHEVIKVADIKSFDWLMNQNVDVNIMNDQGSTPLIAACAVGKLEIVEDLLEKGADANKVSKWGNSPLFTAAGRAEFQMVELLLKHGADAGFIDKDGKTVLHEARPLGADKEFVQNIYKIINLILDEHADKIDLNKKTKFGTSILSNAINNEQLMYKMIEKGASSNVQFDANQGLTPLHMACLSGNIPLIELILNNGFDFSVKDDRGTTAPLLLITYMMNSIAEKKEAMKEMIENVRAQITESLADPSVSDEEKEEMKNSFSDMQEDLEESRKESEQEFKNNGVAILEKFISYGLDTNELYDEKRGMHIMHFPVILNDLELAEKLLDLGFPVNPPSAIHKKMSEYNHKVDSDIKTFKDEIANIIPSPLLFSISKLNSEFVDFFIKNGANVNAVDFSGNNALLKIANTEEDAKINTATKVMAKQTNGMTHEQAQSMYKNIEMQTKELRQEVLNKKVVILDRLIDSGLRINHENENEATALMMAAKYNYTDLIGLLALRYNADLLYKNENEDTALSVALISGNSLLFREMVEVVRNQGRFDETKDVVTQAILTSPEEFNEKTKFLKSLASVGNDPTWINNTKGAIPLIAAIENGDHDTVKVLIESGANVSIKDENGNTPLIYAVVNKDKQSVLLLRSAGADVNEKNDKSISPIALSRSSDYAEVRIAMNTVSPNILEDRSLSFGMDPSLSVEDFWENIPLRNKSKLAM